MTFIESFLPAFAANVANLMVQVAGSKTAAKFTAPETQTSIERCVHHGTTALLSKALSSSRDDLHKLTDCFSDFFEKVAVARELSKLLRGKEPDPEELVYLFEDEGGWNLEKMPPIDFDAGIRAFIAAFMASAKEDPLLNRIICAEQLIEQTRLQRELLEEMRGLSAFLSREGHRVVGIGADKIEARNVANNIVIYEVAPVDAESKRAETEEHHYLKTLIAHCDQLDLATIDEAPTRWFLSTSSLKTKQSRFSSIGSIRATSPRHSMSECFIVFAGYTSNFGNPFFPSSCSPIPQYGENP